MSKAPEWIYLDGDVEAGDGVFPRCFEDPKYASEPPIEYGRIDLLEAAEQRAYADAMEAERKLHEARIEELEEERRKTFQALLRVTKIHDEVEVKLAKAMGALDDLISTYVWIREDEYERGWGEMSNAVHEATFVQMELKGYENE